jgi:hypothetical protein
MFDVSSRDGQLIKADRLHRLTLENLQAVCCDVIDSEALLNGEVISD